MITTEEIMSSEVRALTWKQPYAQLMLAGKIETRTWPTKVRGLVLICAGKKRYTGTELADTAGEKQMGRILDTVGLPSKLQDTCGYAIAIARLVDCRPMTKADEDFTYVHYKEPWTVIRKGKHGQMRILQRRLYCHIYEDVTPIRPFTFKGKQGFYILKGDFAKSFIEPILFATLFDAYA